MINEFSDEEITPTGNIDEIDLSNRRVIMTGDDNAAIAYALSAEEDFFLCGMNDDESIEYDIYNAADEELSIVDALDIGIGYGLDEEELAQLTGRPN